MGTLPRIPVEICGVDVLHAPFFTERRTRGPVQCYVAGIPGRDDKWGVVTFIRGRQIGWTEKKQQVPFDFAQGRLSTSLRFGRDDNSV
jgi:hypothetical protein